MKTKFGRIFALLALLILFSGCSKYTIRGNITDKATNLGIEGVQISLKVEGQEQDRTTLSNKKGDYRIAKDKNKLAFLKAEKENYEPYSLDKISSEQVLNFWLRPTVEETARRIVELEKAGSLDTEDEWIDLYKTYLHPNYQAEYPLNTFLEKERAYKTFYNTLTEEPVVVKNVQTFTNWRDDHQHKVYAEVKKVTLELTTKTGDNTSKIEKEFYFGLAQDYWHLFLVNF